MSKFLQFHHQSDALPRHFERSAPSVNGHPAIVDIFRKFQIEYYYTNLF